MTYHLFSEVAVGLKAVLVIAVIILALVVVVVIGL